MNATCHDFEQVRGKIKSLRAPLNSILPLLGRTSSEGVASKINLKSLHSAELVSWSFRDRWPNRQSWLLDIIVVIGVISELSFCLALGLLERVLLLILNVILLKWPTKNPQARENKSLRHYRMINASPVSEVFWVRMLTF